MASIAPRPSHKCARPARRADGVKGGSAAERARAPLDAVEHRALIERRWPSSRGSDPEAETVLVRRRAFNRLHVIPGRVASIATRWKYNGRFSVKVSSLEWLFLNSS